MKSDPIYIDLRQIKLDAVNAEIGWYNGRRQEALQLISDMFDKIMDVEEAMKREMEPSDPYGNTTLDFGEFTCNTCGYTFDKCSEDHGASGECAGCEAGREIGKDWRAK